MLKKKEGKEYPFDLMKDMRYPCKFYSDSNRRYPIYSRVNVVKQIGKTKRQTSRCLHPKWQNQPHMHQAMWLHMINQVSSELTFITDYNLLNLHPTNNKKI